jgi:hypothetical protein
MSECRHAITLVIQAGGLNYHFSRKINFPLVRSSRKECPLRGRKLAAVITAREQMPVWHAKKHSEPAER